MYHMRVWGFRGIGSVYRLRFPNPFRIGVIMMRGSGLTTVYDISTEAGYEVKVRRGTTFLWGSAGVTENITFNRPLILHVRNDTFGEVVTIGMKKAAGAMKTVGTLQPGELVSLPVQEISGVFASCEFESLVVCLIKE